MPIVRTYACPECNHFIEVTLTADQWDDPAPSCPECDRREMQQQFRPVAIVGSPASKARALTEDIIGNDYQVADIQSEHRKEGVPKVRYKDAPANPSSVAPSTWGVAEEALNTAIALGRQTRLRYGNGLDVLQANLKSGAQPDLIEASKRRSPRVW